MSMKIHQNVHENSPKNVHKNSPKEINSRGQKMSMRIHQKCPLEFTLRKCPLEFTHFEKKVSTRSHWPREVSIPIYSGKGSIGALDLQEFLSCFDSSFCHKQKWQKTY